ncbi:MAG: DNA-3-methyladenine glycosylase I [Pseudomonadota bacterium]
MSSTVSTAAKRTASKHTCPWALGVSDAYLDYHDQEWGVPVTDDATLFEFLVLETAQAGLSWSTILHKRDGYRAAFAGFDAAVVATFDDARAQALREDAGIVRNRAKIASTINNAQQFLKLQDSHGSFARYVWSFVDNMPLQNHWQLQSECPATSDVSDALSKDLKKRGFKFVGSTTMYAFMQAVGMVNDHVLDCPRHAACAALAGAVPIALEQSS